MLTIQEYEDELDKLIDLVLGSSWVEKERRITRKHHGRISFLIRPYPRHLLRRMSATMDHSFDLWTRASDLRSISNWCQKKRRVKNFWTGQYRFRAEEPTWGRNCDTTKSYKELFALMNDQIVVAADEANYRIENDFSIGVPQELMVDISRAADAVFVSDDASDAIRLLNLVQGSERARQARLMGALAAVCLRKKLGDTLITMLSGLSIPLLERSANEVHNNLLIAEDNIFMFVFFIERVEKWIPNFAIYMNRFIRLCEVAIWLRRNLEAQHEIAPPPRLEYSLRMRLSSAPWTESDLIPVETGNEAKRKYSSLQIG